MISLEDLKELFPKGREPILEALAQQSRTVFAEFDMDDRPNRLHFFLAQVAHESGGLSVIEENLRYSAKRMTEIWPSRFPTLAAAEPFAGNPEALANKVMPAAWATGRRTRATAGSSGAAATSRSPAATAIAPSAPPSGSTWKPIRTAPRRRRTRCASPAASGNGRM